MPDGPARRTGRPRDPSIDARALAATRLLLVDEGFAGTTVQAVAARSGVHASAIYRRWPTRLHLIQDAALSDLAPGRIRPTGDLRRDLRRFLRAYVKAFDAPVVRAAMPALVAASGLDPDERPPEVWGRLSVRPQFRAILDAAPPGSVDDTVDPDQVFDLVLGAALVRIVVPDTVRRPPPVAATVELLLRLLAPRDARSDG